MDVEEIVNPFKEKLIHTFQTMLDFKPVPGQIKYGKRDDMVSDITGTIGIAGDISGTVSLRFPRELACRVSSIFLNEEITTINHDVMDTVGELANIIAGGAKGILVQTLNIDFKLAIPTTILGDGHVLGYPAGSSVVIVPFSMGDSTFYLEICLKD
ncbi:MAG: chemotaxis protein CheX [Candidatus Aureabacteria bacterium]|nr:chemotaxis protein CheX [Candidatus Auribacterota bacterium]